MMISGAHEPVACICCAQPKTVVVPFDGAVRSILLSLREEFGQREDAAVNAWRLGHMLFEADAAAGVLADAASLTARPTLYLKGLAQRVYEAGKPDCTTWDQFRKDMTRYDLMDLQQNAWDAIEAGDAASGSIMLTRCLSSTLDVLYESRGWWGVKPKRRLQDLKENALLMNLSSMTERKDAESNSSSLTTTTRNDATQALQLSRRIARNDLELEQRFKSLKSLVAVVVAPLVYALAILQNHKR
ncbi:hypothetical protein BC830DRAFT_1170368 [Chytriomyces sp. MP71]|nr:hypothetical protein BC830DRAFT_1170368 [Chytriomyces sp. MP71]